MWNSIKNAYRFLKYDKITPLDQLFGKGSNW